MKIYLVDDSSFINLVCRQALTKAGYQIVGESYDGEDAVIQILDIKPDIVLMDIALPKKNGLEATSEILTSLPETQIVAISALEEEWVEARAVDAGCVSFLQKPFTADQLVHTVKELGRDGKELKYG